VRGRTKQTAMPKSSLVGKNGSEKGAVVVWRRKKKKKMGGTVRPFQDKALREKGDGQQGSR